MAREEIPLVVLDPATGTIIGGASVSIKSRLTNAVVPVYLLEVGAQEVPQPLASDSSGRVQGWLPRGAYVAEITPPGHAMYPEPFEIVPASDGGFDPNWIADGTIPVSKISGLQTFPPRTTGSFSTASLPSNNEESSSFHLAAGFKLVRIGTNYPARVRFYETAAQRDADKPRPIGTDPSGDHGLILEAVTASGLLSISLSPQPFGSNMDVPTTDYVYYNVQNRDVAARIITTTFDWQRTE